MKDKMIFNMSIVFDAKIGGKVARKKLKAVFQKSDSGYGNDYYLAVYNEDRSFERLFDIRYEQFNPSNPEPFLANWAYNFWSGENGSWDIASLKIEKATMPRSNTQGGKQLDANIIK